MTQTVYVFGHSHVWSVRGVINRPLADGYAFEAPICGTKEMPGPLLYWDHRKKPRLTAVLAALLNRLTPSPDLWLLSMVQGNYYNQLGMLTFGQPFDFISPDASDLPFENTAVHLPYLAVKAAMEAQMANLRIYLERLKNTDFGAQTLIAGVSPPPRDMVHFKPMLEEKGLMTDLSPAHVRLKLWRLQDQIYANICKKQGVEYVSGFISEAQDEDGYLSPEYVKDAVHANGEWAALYLKKVAAAITRRREREDD